MKNLVTTEWLKNNLTNENLIILDVRHVLNQKDYGKEEYNKAHIPNAIFVPVEEFLTGEIKEHGGRHPLPNMKGFTHNMNKLGVDDESTVIIYDDGDLAMAGRLWWMLKFIGFNESYILMGGFKAWEKENNPTTSDMPTTRRGNELSYNLQENMISDINKVKRAISDKYGVVIDSRGSDRYRGQVEPIDRIPGHIPGALNFPWTDLVVDEDLNEITIKEHFKSISNYDEIIVHCGSGITGTVNVLLMEEAGISPKLYVGGYSDWISYPENEVITEI